MYRQNNPILLHKLANGCFLLLLTILLFLALEKFSYHVFFMSHEADSFNAAQPEKAAFKQQVARSQSVRQSEDDTTSQSRVYQPLEIKETFQTSLGQLRIETSDASELSSARLSSDSARAGGLSARLGSAREIFRPARLEKLS